MNVTRKFVQGTITNLTALTTYNCFVHAVTKFGGPKSNFVTVRTDEAGTVHTNVHMYVYTI